MHRIQRMALAPVAALALLSGCTFTHTRHVAPSLRALPATEKLPLKLGVRYTPAFATYEHARSYMSHRYVVPIGEDSVAMLDRVLPLLFAEVVRLPAAPGAAPPAADLVLEPSIEHFDFFFRDEQPSPSSAVVYRMSVFEPGGRLVSSWVIMGRAPFERGPVAVAASAEAPDADAPTAMRDCYTHAADNLDDAARKLVASFRADAQIDAWLAARSAGRPAALEGFDLDARIEDMEVVVPGAPQSLLANRIVPVRVRVTNTGAAPAALGRGPVSLVLPDGRAVSDVGPAAVLSRLDAASSAKASRNILLFGVVGAFVSMSQEDSKKAAMPLAGAALDRSALRLPALAPGQSAEGFVYFPFAEDGAPPDAATVSVWLTGAQLRSARFDRQVRTPVPAPPQQSEAPAPAE